MRNQEYDVIVVGAGLAGLSCAYELTAKGKRVLVLEAHSYAGGRTSSFIDDGMQVESGLHRYIGYYSALPRLLKKCGVPVKKIVQWEKEVEIPVKGSRRKVVLGLAPVFGFSETVHGIFGNRDSLSVRDKLSLVPFFLCGFTSYLFSKKLDRFSVAEYAEHHSVTRNARRLILEPLSSGIFFLPPENYSAYAFFGLFAPAIPKFYKMRIGAYLGGMTETMCNPVVRRIQAMGGRFLFGETVESVLVKNRSVVGVRSRKGEEFRAKYTVIATPLPAAKSILTPLREEVSLQKIFSLPTMSACTLQMELDAPAWHRDITVFGPGTDMVSFAEQSRSTFPGKKGRLSVILGNPEEYAKKSVQEITEVVTEQMETLGISLRGHILRVRKVCENHDFYSLDKGNQVLRPKQETAVPGLLLAGDYTLTSSFATMEGAVLSGKKAAKKIR